MFKRVEGNRPINERYVTELKKEIERKNLLHVNPILVSDDYTVIDGQHRLAIAQDLGVPIYPGAEVEEGTAGKVETSDEEGTESMAGAVLRTNDSVDDVIAWYRDKLSGMPGFQDTSMEMEGEKLGMFSVQKGDETVTVMIAASDEGNYTEIVISVATGMEEMPETPKTE